MYVDLPIWKDSPETPITAEVLNLYREAINNLQERDYIVEQGQSGIWMYRKWSSGVAECWGTFSEDLEPYSTGNYLIPRQPYPFEFADSPIDNASIAVGNGTAYQAMTYGYKDAFSCVATSNLNDKRRVIARIHVIGMWY